MANEKYPIKPEWKSYYFTLENIRRSGICNMWGASVYLKQFCPELTEKESQEILCNWIENYDTLNEMYGWR
jgi:hypothetical protein